MCLKNCKSVDIVNIEIDSIKMVFCAKKINEVEFMIGLPIK